MKTSGPNIACGLKVLSTRLTRKKSAHTICRIGSFLRTLAVTAPLAGSCAFYAVGCAAGNGMVEEQPAPKLGSSAWNREDALLRVYYPPAVMAGNARQLKLDERLCSALPNNGYLEMPVPPGNHVLALRDAMVNFVARPGQVIYVRVHTSAWSGRGELAVVPQEIGRREIRSTHSVENSELPPFTCDEWPPCFKDPAVSGLSDASVAILHNANAGWPAEECFGRDCTFQVYELRRLGGEQPLYIEPRAGHPYRHLGRVYHFRLSPGRYVITYQTDARSTRRWVTRTDTVDLRAGHVYRAKQQYDCVGLGALFRLGCNGHWRGSGLFVDGTVWIEDKTTGEIIAGEKWY